MQLSPKNLLAVIPPNCGRAEFLLRRHLSYCRLPKCSLSSIICIAILNMLGRASMAALMATIGIASGSLKDLLSAMSSSFVTGATWLWSLGWMVVFCTTGKMLARSSGASQRSNLGCRQVLRLGHDYPPCKHHPRNSYWLTGRD